MNEIINVYINFGISLFSKGENVVILPIQNAILLLNKLEKLNLIILGGDVYYVENKENIKHSYNSWYYNGNSVKESYQRALDYLSSLAYGDYYVSFVFET